LPLPWRSPVNGRVDFAYPEIRLIIELDGRAWHSTLEAFESDRMRDNHAQLAGWRVLRITYRMLKDNPQMVRDLVRRALSSAA
jgi:very-short-patch-repair endonuclease